MDLRIPRARRRPWALAAAAVALAAGGLVLLRAPEPASAVPAIEAPPPDATPGSARAALRGPRIDGFFAFTEGAMLANGARTAYAQLRLTGEDARTTRRAPVALVVVLDRSGSMSGDKIVQAREAVVQLIDRMEEDDRIAIVLYDDWTEVLQPLERVGNVRTILRERVRAVQIGSGTNIPGGLDAGAQVMAAAPPGFVRRLVLVSDGQDMSGLPLEHTTARVSARAAELVTTSALGIGLDYDDRFLGAVADAGRGNYEFLASGAMLDGFLRRELDQAATTVAEDVMVDLELPAGSTLRNAYGAIAAIDGRRVRLPIGSLFAGERRKVVLELATSAGAVGSLASASVRMQWRTVDDGRSHQTPAAVASVRAVASDAEVNASRDVELHADALSTAIDAQQMAAMTAWREGRRDEALRMTDQHLGTLRQAQAVSPTPTVAARIRSLDTDRSTFSAASAGSSEGQAYRLSRGSTQRSQAEAF
jgi:Ca-activated chloride channel family protein